MTSDGFYQPWRIRTLLDFLPELLAYAKPHRPTGARGRRSKRQVTEPYEFEIARLVADLQRALAELARRDPPAAAFVEVVYCAPALWRLPLGERVAIVATEHNLSVSEGWRLLSRAVGELAAILGGSTRDLTSTDSTPERSE